MTLLALGDSYTIGEGVETASAWPNLVGMNLQHHLGRVPKVVQVAKTGWTTYELLHALDNPWSYEASAVVLLIGVNNQYRGYPIEAFAREYKILLTRAKYFAGGDVSRVCALSIPDWGVSPFANPQDRPHIAREIEAHNKVVKRLTNQYGAHFLDLFSLSRKCTNQVYFAEDNLHPSRLQYEKWAAFIEPVLMRILRK